MSTRSLPVLAATALVLLLLPAGSPRAEWGFEPSKGIGIKAGMVSSRWYVQSASTSNRNGGLVGAFARMPAGPVAVQMELLWSRKGFKKKSYGDYENLEVRTGNFEVPVCLVLELPASSVHVYLLGGMSFGHVGGVEKRDDAAPDWQSVDNLLKSSNVLAVLGLGLRYERFTLEFRFNHGVKNLAESDVDGEIKDEGFAFTAGFAIWN